MLFPVLVSLLEEPLSLEELLSLEVLSLEELSLEELLPVELLLLLLPELFSELLLQPVRAVAITSAARAAAKIFFIVFLSFL